MKRKKLERLIVEIIEDRESIGRELDRLAGVPSEGFAPLIDQYRTIKVSGSTFPYLSTGSSTIVCTCPPNRGDNYAGSCWLHDYTTVT